MNRFLHFVALLMCAGSAYATTPLPATATLGFAELPIRDAAEFFFLPSEIGVIRSTDSIVGIPAQFSSDNDSIWTETFKIPDGKLMVITQFELPETAKNFAWLERMSDDGADIGWTVYSAYVTLDFEGSSKPLAPLATPLVLAPGKTYKLHSNAAGVNAKGFYLEESSSP